MRRLLLLGFLLLNIVGALAVGGCGFPHTRMEPIEPTGTAPSGVARGTIDTEPEAKKSRSKDAQRTPEAQENPLRRQ